MTEKQFKCEHCDASFDRLNQLTGHLKAHPQPKRRLYRREVVECRGCGARGVLGAREPAFVQMSKGFATVFKAPQPAPGIYCTIGCACDTAVREAQDANRTVRA